MRLQRNIHFISFCTKLGDIVGFIDGVLVGFPVGHLVGVGVDLIGLFVGECVGL